MQFPSPSISAKADALSRLRGRHVYRQGLGEVGAQVEGGTVERGGHHAHTAPRQQPVVPLRQWVLLGGPQCAHIRLLGAGEPGKG